MTDDRKLGPRAGRRMWRFLVPLVAAMAVSASAQDDQAAEKLRAVRAHEARRVAVFEQAARSVVCIFGSRNRQGGGSGVVISEDGYGLTNYHVIASMLETRAGFGGLSDGRLYPLEVLGIDPGGDVAMFKLSGKDRFDAAPLGDSDSVRVGDWAAAMGNPFVLAEDFTPTITYGIVSGTHRYQQGQGNALEYADCIQVSSSINPGNSGGPLFNMSGEVIGINGRASFGERRRVNVGLGYAIGINQIKRFMPALRAGQVAAHGTLGATVLRVGDELIFDAIQDISPVDRAGIRLADRLLAINDRPVRTANAFLNVLTPLPAGWPTKVTVQRDGRTIESTVRLERIIVPMQRKYELDFAHNHNEIRRLFARYALRDHTAPQRPLETITWFGEVTVASSDASSPDVIVVVQSAAGSIAVEHLATCAAVQIEIADKLPESESTQAAWSDPRLWSEWHQITMPVLARAKITLGWELIGGDLVDGRVAYVVERRFASGGRVRWKFDLETGRVVQAAVGREAVPEAALWTPIAGAAADAWPPAWTRVSTDLPPITVEVEGFSPTFAESDSREEFEE